MGNIIITCILGMSIGFVTGVYANTILDDLDDAFIFDFDRYYIPHEQEPEKICHRVLPREIINELKEFDLSRLVNISNISAHDSASSLDIFKNDPMLRSKSPESSCSTPTHIENPINELIERGKKLPLELLINMFMTSINKNIQGQIDIYTKDIDEIMKEQGKYLFISGDTYHIKSKYNIFSYMGSSSKISERIYILNNTK